MMSESPEFLVQGHKRLLGSAPWPASLSGRATLFVPLGYTVPLGDLERFVTAYLAAAEEVLSQLEI